VTASSWPDGVTGLDHMADVGLIVRAPTLEDLFRRAADGMMALLVGGADEEATGDQRRPSPARGDAPGTEREVALDAPDLEALLVAWLRELLFLFQVRGFGCAAAHFEALSATRLKAHVSGGPSAEAVMELKGVTYHALAVRREGDGWFARVVFDV
jgi:SHS2 domain-containing protein